MTRLFLLILIGPLAVAGILFLIWQEEVVAPVSQERQSFSYVSLPAMMEKEYDGRDLKLGPVQADNEAYTRYFITYKSGQLTISGILNIPKGQPPAGGWPVVFLNHGHIDPAIYTNGRGLRREQDYLARQGLAVLHSDYRGHAQSDKDENADTNIRLGYVEDVINAVLAVKNSGLSQLSKEKFGMLGHSMGGGVAQQVMVVKPDLIKAVVLYAPVSSNVVDSYNKWLSRDSGEVEKINARHGSPEENPKFWQQISPRNYFDRVAVPVLIFHGTADESCEIAWSRQTRDLLVEAGKNIKLVEFPGEPHEFKNIKLVEFPGEPHEFAKAHSEFMRQSTEFFKNNL